MVRRAALGVAALACSFACAEAEAPRGTGRVPPPPLGACLDLGGAAPPSGSASVEGLVTEAGLGLADPADLQACPFDAAGGMRFGAPFLGEPELLAQTSWLRVRSADGEESVLSVLAEGFAFPLAPGDTVQAQIGVGFVGFNAQLSSFEARSEDGALLFWIGAGLRLSDLTPPEEVAITTAEVLEEIADDCVGSYRVRALNVAIAGETVSVRSGARAETGAWTVVNAVTQEQTGNSVCPDALADGIQVAVWTRRGQVRESGGIGGLCYASLPIEQSEGAPQYRCLPDATLTRECGPRAPCPGFSECVAGSCLAPGD